MQMPLLDHRELKYRKPLLYGILVIGAAKSDRSKAHIALKQWWTYISLKRLILSLAVPAPICASGTWGKPGTRSCPFL